MTPPPPDPPFAIDAVEVAVTWGDALLEVAHLVRGQSRELAPGVGEGARRLVVPGRGAPFVVGSDGARAVLAGDGAAHRAVHGPLAVEVRVVRIAARPRRAWLRVGPRDAFALGLALAAVGAALSVLRGAAARDLRTPAERATEQRARIAALVRGRAGRGNGAAGFGHRAGGTRSDAPAGPTAVRARAGQVDARPAAAQRLAHEPRAPRRDEARTRPGTEPSAGAPIDAQAAAAAVAARGALRALETDRHGLAAALVVPNALFEALARGGGAGRPRGRDTDDAVGYGELGAVGLGMGRGIGWNVVGAGEGIVSTGIRHGGATAGGGWSGWYGIPYRAYRPSLTPPVLCRIDAADATDGVPAGRSAADAIAVHRALERALSRLAACLFPRVPAPAGQRAPRVARFAFVLDGGGHALGPSSVQLDDEPPRAEPAPCVAAVLAPLALPARADGRARVVRCTARPIDRVDAL